MPLGAHSAPCALEGVARSGELHGNTVDHPRRLEDSGGPNFVVQWWVALACAAVYQRLRTLFVFRQVASTRTPRAHGCARLFDWKLALLTGSPGETYSLQPICMVAALHLYHLTPGLGFKLGFADYFHHILFAGAICGAGLL